ncbi:hypothetical protein VCR12J2_680220 [Vibrio coralliirubri]|nr:hypothetical protein VCR1J2_200117 [Vibrio coralliirubri]CDT77805.1 hypothetical protein VCR8J2_190625 [Vibrio coralliirubri]CDT79306.1 hypothetical protein VCR26J2_370684 [Vibrio coralliirubri]CDU06186.1 hypothetical protein VCR12J2_680220 [Vibrio coralliirubri]
MISSIGVPMGSRIYRARDAKNTCMSCLNVRYSPNTFMPHCVLS